MVLVWWYLGLISEDAWAVFGRSDVMICGFWTCYLLDPDSHAVDVASRMAFRMCTRSLTARAGGDDRKSTAKFMFTRKDWVAV